MYAYDLTKNLKFIIIQRNTKMKTKLLNFCKKNVATAAEVIKNGGVVAFPTETVYGLGANALDERAVEKIFLAKGRPNDNPLIVHVYSKSQIKQIACDLSKDAEKIIDKLLPGSLTLVLKKRSCIPSNVTAGLDTVAVRMPKSREAREFIKACGVPIAAPSANRSGRPSPTTAEQVAEDMDGRLPVILSGKPCRVGIESTVLDLTGDNPKILRPGIVSATAIEKVISKKVNYLNENAPTAKLNSPGLRYKHYAPLCEMLLNIDGDEEKILKLYNIAKEQGKRTVILLGSDKLENLDGVECVCLGNTDAECARNLFGMLRKLEKKYDLIIAVWMRKGEVADSVLNRLIRSAGHNIF